MSSILFYSTGKSKILRKKLNTQKNGPSGAPGSASASPWRAERGTLPKLSTFLSQNIKKLKGEKFLFSEKNLTVPKKTERGDPLGFSNIHSVAKQQKIERGPFGLAGYGMLRGKTGKTLLVSS